jgi:[ribosomal protein S5]-alanine N-acetyltransferase
MTMDRTASTQPTLSTPRLVLRPFALSDAPAVQRLAGAREVAASTLNVPHPYPDGAAEEWIRSHAPKFAEGTLAPFALTLRSDRALVGAMGLTIASEHAHAELGYWVGVPFWGQGYATEAARAVIRYGFVDLGLNRVFAHHFTSNPASGRVLAKAGMRYEGELRQHINKWGVFHDVALYGILAADHNDP